MIGPAQIDRRTLLFAGVAAALPAVPAPSSPETLSDWINANAKTRNSGAILSGPYSSGG